MSPDLRTALLVSDCLKATPRQKGQHQLLLRVRDSDGSVPVVTELPTRGNISSRAVLAKDWSHFGVTGTKLLLHMPCAL